MRYKILLGILTVVAGVVIIAAGAKHRADAHYYDGYVKSLPLNVQELAVEDRPGYRRAPFYFDSLPDQRVPGLLALPLGEGPFPCIIFLHGIGQSKGFLDEIAPRFTKEGFALVTYDQYTRGERELKDASKLEDAQGLRRRAALNVIDTRRLIDYLEERPDIAEGRIYLVGASFGAITGATAAALDDRMRAVVLTYGGGNLPLLLNSQAARDHLGGLSWVASRSVAYYMSAADPLLYVGKISPRPVLFQNGKADTLIPSASAKALYDAARQPKEIIWYEGDHVGLDVPTTERVLDDAVRWIKARDAEICGRTVAASGAS